MRNLAILGNRGDGSSHAKSYQPHELSQRLGAQKVKRLVDRAQGGESVRSLARELGVANSALTRMLREEGVPISKRRVGENEAVAMKREDETGATMAELEQKYGLSHGAVSRALHRAGVEMRASAPRQKLV